MTENAFIVSGFPGVGKSYLTKHTKGLTILDSDSSSYSWSEPNVRNPEFPRNYVEHIKKSLSLADIILISSHKVVRDELVKNNLPFILVYPDRNLKEIYLQRYKDRKNTQSFIDLLANNWDQFNDEIVGQEGCQHLVLTREKPYLTMDMLRMAAGIKHERDPAPSIH